MSAAIQTTHMVPPSERVQFWTVIQREQGAQGFETVEVLPEDFNRNAGDEVVEEEDASSECLARAWIEGPVVAIGILPARLNSVLESVSTDKSDKLFDCPDLLRKHEWLEGDTGLVTS
jgi:hypothetical protein